MTMQVRLGGAWKEITGGKIFVSGAWRTLVAGKAYSGAAWRDVANFTPAAPDVPLSLAVNNSEPSGSGTTSIVTSGLVIATPTGGLAPYTYSWVKLSGDAITATAPAAARTSFRATGMIEDEVRVASFRCTCTDSLGSSATADVTVTLRRRFDSGNQ